MGPLLTVLIAATREEDGALRQIDLWKGRGRA
jgi:hypothetical protein